MSLDQFFISNESLIEVIACCRQGKNNMSTDLYHTKIQIIMCCISFKIDESYHKLYLHHWH